MGAFEEEVEVDDTSTKAKGKKSSAGRPSKKRKISTDEEEADLDDEDEVEEEIDEDEEDDHDPRNSKKRNRTTSASAKKTKIKKKRLRELHHEAAAECRIVLGTYKMFEEGIDVPRLDTLICASPCGDIEQSLGRILRSHPNKNTPHMIYLADMYSVYEGMAWKASSFCKGEEYIVKWHGYAKGE